MKNPLILFVFLLLFSCKPTEDFFVNMRIENRIPDNDYNYNIYQFGWVDDDTTTVDFEVSISPYTEKGLADKHDNFWLEGDNFKEKGLKEAESIRVEENIETDEGTVAQVRIQSFGTNQEFWINNNDEVEVIAYDPYYFEVRGNTGEDPRPEEPEPEDNGVNSACGDFSNYQNQGMDFQYEAQCKVAYVYDCASDPRLDEHCDFYRQLQQQLSLPDCPYCD